jgi:hypothetical protein
VPTHHNLDAFSAGSRCPSNISSIVGLGLGRSWRSFHAGAVFKTTRICRSIPQIRRPTPALFKRQVSLDTGGIALAEQIDFNLPPDMTLHWGPFATSNRMLPSHSLAVNYRVQWTPTGYIKSLWGSSVCGIV